MNLLRNLRDKPEPHLPLANAKLEQFAQQKADGKTHRQAAEAVGYSGHPTATAALANRPGVRERIAYLKRERLASIEGQREQVVEVIKSGFDADKVTVDLIASELFINIQAARAAGDFKESTSAIKALAELVGLQTVVKDPNKGGSNGPNPLTGGTINVQINNSGTHRPGAAPGAIVEAWSDDSAEGADTPAPSLPDKRTIPLVGSGLERAWDDDGDVSVPAQGDGAEQPVGVRRVHDA
jgi:hypothetical protein